LGWRIENHAGVIAAMRDIVWLSPKPAARDILAVEAHSLAAVPQGVA
jgi:hypothetical protein